MAHRHRIEGLVLLLLSFTASIFAQDPNWSIHFFVQFNPSPYIADWERNPTIANLSIIYRGDRPMRVVVSAEILGGGYPWIARGRSRVLEFERPEEKRIDNTEMVDWNSVEYQGELADRINRSGRIPEGQYQICIEVRELESERILARDCKEFIIMGTKPPMLITPRDNDTLPTLQPNFSWTPAIASPGRPVHYFLRLWHIGPEEEITAALDRPPFFETLVRNITSFTYIPREPALEFGQSFLCQVQAVDEADMPFGENEGRSETVKFTLNKPGLVVEKILPLLPQYLIIGDFTLTVQSYQPGATMDSLAGTAEGSFLVAQTDPATGGTMLTTLSFDVKFDKLKAVLVPQKPETGLVTKGEIRQDYKPPLSFDLSGTGLVVDMHRIYLAVDTATATIAVPLHKSLGGAKGCDTAFAGPAVVAINPSFDVYADLPDKFGPFTMRDLGIVFGGEGVIIDLSLKKPAAAPGWRGVVLKQGSTTAHTALDTSNVGFLYAKYNFTNDSIGSSGMKTKFKLDQTWNYLTLTPLAYSVRLDSGSLDIEKSRVKKGTFKADGYLPNSVADTATNDPVNISLAVLTVDSLLNVQAMVGIRGSGNRIGLGSKSYYYTVVADTGELYLPAGPEPMSKLFFDDTLTYDRATIEAHLDSFPLPGLTITEMYLLKITSPDVWYAGKPADLEICCDPKGWLNVATRGVIGDIYSAPLGDQGEDLYPDLGRLKYAGYKSDSLFKTRFEHSIVDTISVSFVHNAVYDSYFSGELDIPYPCSTKIPFTDMEFTSIASSVGGISKFEKPCTLAYWGVEFTSKQGVVSVRTGEIIFTNADIYEKRHFSKGFNIYWGEMRADGNLGKFFFNYNSGNQKFDGFTFTVHSAGLSKYDPKKSSGSYYGNDALLGCLEAKGDISFPFWGSTHDSIYDYKYPKGTNDPYNLRFVRTKPTTFSLKREWGSGSAKMDFPKVWYDSLGQDGFLGVGSIALLNQLAGNIDTAWADINRKLTLIAFCSPTTGVAIGGLGVKFGSSQYPLSGSITIIGDKMERFSIESALEMGGTTGSSAVSAEMEIYGSVSMEVTPTQIKFASRAGASFILLDLVGIMGTAGINLVLSNSSIEGDITGRFETFPSQILVADIGISIQGQFNFYIGTPTATLTIPPVYFQGSGEVWVKWGVEVKLAAAFFAGVNAPLDKIWVIDEISKGPKMSDLLKDELKMSTTTPLTGFYIAGKFGYGIDVGVVEGSFDLWGGLGCFVSLSSPPGVLCIAHAGVSVYGELLWGVVSGSAWVDMKTAFGVDSSSFPLPKFTLCGTLGLEACAIWIICTSWEGTLCFGTNGISAE